MNEIIKQVRSLRKQQKELEKIEISLINSISMPTAPIESIKSLYFKEKGISEFRNMEQKKMFVFLGILIICPTFMIGDRLPYSVRKNLAYHTKIHPVQISYISKSVITYCSIYRDFKVEADYLYNSIKRSLTS